MLRAANVFNKVAELFTQLCQDLILIFDGLCEAIQISLELGGDMDAGI